MISSLERPKQKPQICYPAHNLLVQKLLQKLEKKMKMVVIKNVKDLIRKKL